MGEKDLGHVGGGLKILTWNINGIRSLGDFQERLIGLGADIVCVQETKVTRDMLTETVACIPGYSSYFSFSRRRTGYSGVATFCRLDTATPCMSEEGLAGTLEQEGWLGGCEELAQEFSSEELKSLDSEGRCVITRHSVVGREGGLVVFNLYCPRADPEREDRKRYKQLFYKALDIRASKMKRGGDMVVVVGDINTSHREIDHCDPYEEFGDRPDRRFLTHFLADYCPPSNEERLEDKTNEVDVEDRSNADEEEVLDDWVSNYVNVEEKQFIDSFRIFHPTRERAFTCWNTEKNCRATNYGTRIDYVFVSLSLAPLVTSCDILPEVMGSDHCPVQAEFNIRLSLPNKPPVGCTKYFPEFAGKQAKVSDFFTQGQKPSELKRRMNDHAGCPAKKPKIETKKKITNFFAPKVSNKPAICEESNTNVPEMIHEEALETIHGSQSNQKKNGEAKTAWGALFKPVAPAPLCPGHKEAAKKSRVNKKGPNIGREFWACQRGEGRSDDPEARCNFFKWVK